MAERKTVIQLVHGYNAPFFELSNQYGQAFDRTQWRVVTVFLTGKADLQLQHRCIADDVVFLSLRSRDLKGLKLKAIGLLRALCRQYQPQLIVAQRYKPLYVALLATIGSGTSVLGVAHAFGVMRQRLRRLLVARFAHRLVLAGVSDAVADDMRQAFAAEKAPPIASLPNAIDVALVQRELLARDEARAAMRLPAAAFVFGNVGRLHPDKDQATLVRAFAVIASQCTDALLVLVGEGRDHDRLEQLITQLALDERVILFGRLPFARRYFRAFDVYVSGSDSEPFGIVLLEAMAAALPVISTDCGGAPQVLGEAASYFSCGNDAALAAQMQAVYAASAAQRNATGLRLGERLPAFDTAAFAARLRDLLVSLEN